MANLFRSGKENGYPLHRIVAVKFLNRGEQVYDLGEFKMQLDLSESAMMLERYDRKFESAISELLTTELATGDVYVDIGSNRGYHVLEAATIVGDEGTVLAFEPYPENFEVLTTNIKQNSFTNVDTYEMAVSDSNGSANYSIGKKSGWGRLSEIGSLTVTTQRFDDVMERNSIDIDDIDVIKIDVEGAELDVLAGMSQVLQNSDAIVAVEVHDESDLALIRGVAEKSGRELNQLDQSHWLIQYVN